jgi:drug/metabolite transporter (DMT)-like permease
MRKTNKWLINMLIGAVMISTSAVWVNLADVAPSTSGFYRMFIGGLILLIWSLLVKDRLWLSWKYYSKLFLVAVLFAVDLYFWHRSIIYIGPGLATLLGNFQVFFMAIVGFVFFKEILRWNFILGLIVTFAGLFLMVGLNWADLSNQYQLGVVFGLSTAIAYTGFLLTMRNVEASKNSLSTSSNLAIIGLTTALLMAIVVYFEGNSFSIPNVKTGLSLLALGVFPQVIAWVLITKAMPNLPASIVGILLLLQPALSMLWDVLFFDRPMSQYDIVGFFMVLVGVYLATVKRSGR